MECEVFLIKISLFVKFFVTLFLLLKRGGGPGCYFLLTFYYLLFYFILFYFLDPKFKIADCSYDTLMLFVSMFILSMSHDDETLPNRYKKESTQRKGEEKKTRGKESSRSIVYLIRFSI